MQPIVVGGQVAVYLQFNPRIPQELLPRLATQTLQERGINTIPYPPNPNPSSADLHLSEHGSKKGEYIHPFPNERAANRRTFHAFIHSPHYDNNKLQPLLTNVIRQQEFSLTETQSNKFAFENDYHSHLSL